MRANKDDMGTIKDRCLEFLRLLDIGQNSFEKKCNISTGYISNNKGSFGSKIISRISVAYPELNTEWLLTGEGEMLKPPKNDFSQLTEDEISEAIADRYANKIMKMYQAGEIYSAEVYNRVVAEKDSQILKLQQEIWKLQQEIDTLKKP